ncbi:Amino acid transporter AVT1J [Camellia lanceoleosa]|uniref:Amino acid transporter AVT1J n=1 Tax=Camellia lanceoleosa TaxID=1840588 RepID=A0ACC0J1E3_9ERIC|nr:Amino acid transporter AVT1J [Camellia lanceoleosa]
MLFISGVGILSVPYALALGGWLSIILLFIIASSTLYIGLLIKRCMDVDPNIRSYTDIGELAFGSKGRMVVSIFMNMEVYLVVTSFLIVEGDNLQNLLPNMGFEIAGLRIGGKQMFVIIVGLIILPTIWLNDMSIRSYISTSGVLTSIIILGLISWVAMSDGIGFHENGTLHNWNGIATTMSLFDLCYCDHHVFPTLYTSIKNKNQLTNVKQK